MLVAHGLEQALLLGKPGGNRAEHPQVRRQAAPPTTGGIRARLRLCGHVLEAVARRPNSRCGTPIAAVPIPPSAGHPAPTGPGTGGFRVRLLLQRRPGLADQIQPANLVAGRKIPSRPQHHQRDRHDRLSLGVPVPKIPNILGPSRPGRLFFRRSLQRRLKVSRSFCLDYVNRSISKRQEASQYSFQTGFSPVSPSPGPFSPLRRYRPLRENPCKSARSSAEAWRERACLTAQPDDCSVGLQI